MEFPHVDLPVDLIAWTDVTEDILNIYKQSCRLKGMYLRLVHRRFHHGIHQSYRYRNQARRLHHTASGHHHPVSRAEGESAHLLCRIFRTLPQRSQHHPVHHELVLQDYRSSRDTAQRNLASYFRDYFALLARISTGPYMPKTRMAQNVLDTLLYGVNELYSSRPDSQNRIKSRKEEICREFIQLVIENYTTERRAQFYAAKLGISLQHLSTTIKQVTGKNVLDLIAHVVIIDIKAKLKSTDMTIQEIAYSLNFPSASFFGKYFKRHLGMSPLEYRNS